MVLARGDVTGGGRAQALTPMNSIRVEGWPGLVASKGGAEVKQQEATRKQTEPEPKWSAMPQIRPDAAGLDIGEAEIVACVPPERAARPIRSFGTFTPDLQALVEWLEGCGIKTVAMESTGVYWIPLYELLEERGIEAYLVNARHLKHVPGRKSDVCDAQWIQRLHSYGLLAASFLPAAGWRPLRTYWRHRQGLVEHRAPHIQHMQKALGQMNLRLTQVLSDITGVTGLAIIRAIVAGERNPVRLAQLRDRRCQHSDAEIAKALSGAYRQEHLFTLKQALALYDFYTAQLAECDAQLEQEYAKLLQQAPFDQDDLPPLGPDPKKNSHAKNAPAFDVRASLYPLVGIDLVAVSGLEASSVQTIVSEIGTDMSRWPTAKHFCSWLGLAPHNDISGGKVLASKTLKGRNRAGQAFRLAAQSVGRGESAFGAFFRRLRARIGVQQAIVATAHKIARTVYAMLKHRLPFQEAGAHEYERRYRQRVVASLNKRALALGLRLVPKEAVV
jgi:transposase